MTMGTLTQAGSAAHAAALANETPLAIASIAWGTDASPITGAETQLRAETGRAQVVAHRDLGGGKALFRIVWGATDGPYAGVRELGLIASDGTLIAIGVYPSDLNKLAGEVITVNFVVAFGAGGSLAITLEGGALVPVERLVNTGDGLSGGGDLSADRTFSLDFASEAEAIAGVSEVTVMSPARTKDAIDDRVTRLVGAAPADLDTLAELAEAIGNDDDFFATMMKRTRPRRARRAYFGGR